MRCVPFLVAFIALVLPACDHAGTFEDGVLHKGSVTVHVGPVPGRWRRVYVEGATFAFRDDARAASALFDVHCGQRDGDAPLTALTAQLLMGTTERDFVSEEVVPFDDREALHTTLRAKLDGVPMQYDIYVMKKDDCVYDLVYVAEPDRFTAGAGDFELFARGLHAASPPVGKGRASDPVSDQAPESAPPPSRGPSNLPPPPPEPALLQVWGDRAVHFVEHLGDVASLSAAAARSIVRRPFEIGSTIYQIESLGVRSLGIVAVTSIFIGMVMTIQFAFGLQRFGGLEYIPRVIVLAFLRELGPTLTAVIVGGRIGSGIAAEVGAMNVTEQVDAIRALGADPAKKLVLPRVAAAMIVMPLLSIFADALGTLGASMVCSLEYGIRPRLFMESALESVLLTDLFSGLAKTPIFGFIIAIVGCHFGLTTRGGTEGVGQSTTRTVVVVSIAILVADYLLTRIFVAILPG